MNKLNKALVGTAAATALAVSATPAMARGGHNDGGVSAGEVIAGAVILGGLAAILTSGKKDRYNNDYRDGRYRQGDNRHSDYRQSDYRNGRYNKRRIGQRKAVNKCIRAAERRASRFGSARVTDVRDIKRTRYGYKVKGRIAVNNNYRSHNRSRHYRTGYGNGNGGYDQGKFTCYIEGRQVSDIRLKGLGNRY